MPWDHTFIKQSRMSAKCLNGSISFISGPFIGHQRAEDLLIRVLSWYSFSERVVVELWAGNTRICSRANKINSRKGGKIQGGRAQGQHGGSLIIDSFVCQGFSSWPHHEQGPRWPCLPGIFLMTSSWVGPPIMAPGNTGRCWACAA